MTITFSKYQGTGNDFIIIDNREGKIELSAAQIKNLCDRKFGIGADGLILLNLKPDFDFEMKYYNSDGNESSMCGNGGRCLIKFAKSVGIHKNKYHFSAIDGEHEGAVEEDGQVNLCMQTVKNIDAYEDAFLLDTGSPHYVTTVEDIKKVDVKNHGKNIRNSEDFKEKGVNVNFVEQQARHIYVRTYERGVEDETLSCGTGVTAAALVFAHNDNGFNHVEVETPGGHLAVEFDKNEDGVFSNICLKGSADFVFKGEIKI